MREIRAVKRSKRVTLTVVAVMGLAGRGLEAADPCDASTFNGKACKIALKQGGYCFNGETRVVNYPESYPYYYNLYQLHVMQGGAVTPAVVDPCTRHWGGSHGVSRGGFGSTCAAHAASAAS